MAQGKGRRLCAAMLIGAATLALVVAAPAHAQAAKLRLSIPAQGLASALSQFAMQSKEQLVYSPQVVSGRRTSGVDGSYTAREALDLLLSDTGLRVRTTPNGAFLIDVAAPAATPPSVLAAAPTAQPQNLTVRPTPVEEIQEVVVTGTFLYRGLDQASPVTVLDREELAQTPRTSLGEFLHADPAFSGSEVYTSFGTGLGSSASASVNLRGLGSRATLVLLNGRRSTENAQPTRDGVVTFDINSILPEIAVQRIDVLKDGASALYGTDAVAGVVNFITRDNFEGLEVKASGHRLHTSGASEVGVAGIFGAQGEKTKIIAALEYMNRDPFDYLSFPEVAAFAQVNGSLSNFGSPGSFRLIEGQQYNGLVPAGAANRLIRDPLCGDPRIGPGTLPGVPGYIGAASANQQVCLADGTLGRAAISGLKRVNGFMKASYEPTPLTSLGIEAGFSRETLDRKGGYGNNLPELLTPAANPYNLFGGDVLFRGRIQGPAAGLDAASPTHSESNTWRVAILADAYLTSARNWRFSGSFTSSHNEANAARYDVVLDRFTNALKGLGGQDCNVATGSPGVGACKYWNPFATAYLNQPNDPALLNYIQQQSLNFATADLITGTAMLSGNLFRLPAGPVGLAVGAEYRDSSIKITYDPLTLRGEFAFVSRAIPLDAGRSAKAVFAEAAVPVFKGFNLQLAGRYEDYGLGVDAFVPKVGMVWTTPLDGLTVRGTFGKSFKAPGLVPTYSTIAGVTNPVNVPGVYAPLPFTQTLPNLDLEPERAKTYTAGFTWDLPRRASLSLDAWRYDFFNLIGQESAALVVQDYVSRGLYADRLTFDASGELRRIVLRFNNFSALKTEGLDFSVGWRLPSERFGQLAFSARGTWTSKYRYQLRKDQAPKDGLGRTNESASTFVSPLPELKTNIAVTWNGGGHSARGTLRYISGILSDTIADNDPRQSDRDYFQLDLVYGYTFGFLGGAMNVQFGIQNVNDARPPLLTGLQQAIPGVYDPRGRVYTLDITKRF